MRKTEGISVVIRSAGERTLKLCRVLAEKQVPRDKIHVIEEKPFFKAVKKTIEIGAGSPDKYLLALDADILLYPDAVTYMLHEAKIPEFESSLKFDFRLDDKFRGNKTWGIHLYNNRYTEGFFKFLSQFDDNHDFLRPESDNLKIYALQTGLCASYKSKQIAGKHDFFQFYKDLHLKYKVRYKRCLNDGKAGNLIKTVNENFKNHIDDTDLIFVKEILSNPKSNIEFTKIMEKLSLKEKEPFNDEVINMISGSLSAYKIMDNLPTQVDDKLRNMAEWHDKFKNFIENLYPLEKINGKTAVYGDGVISEILLSILKHINIKAVINKDASKPDNNFINGIPVIPLSYALDCGIENIIIASISHENQIRDRINNEFPDNKINIISAVRAN